MMLDRKYSNEELAQAVKAFNRHERRHGKSFRHLEMEFNSTVRQWLPLDLDELVERSVWAGWDEDPLIRLMIQNVKHWVETEGYFEIDDPDYVSILEHHGFQSNQIGENFWEVF